MFDLSFEGACLDNPFEHPSMQGINLSDSSEAGRTPQEARIREEVRLTLVKLDEPDYSWERHQHWRHLWEQLRMSTPFRSQSSAMGNEDYLA